MSDLFPCPFCGGTDIAIVHDADYIKWLVRCHGCGARGPREDSEGDAVAAWNARADLIAAKDAEIARLTQKLTAFKMALRRVIPQSLTNSCALVLAEARVAGMRAEIARLRREVAAAEAAALERAAGALWPAILAAEGTGEVAREAALSFAVDAIRALPRDGSALGAVVAERTAGLRHAALELDSFMRGDGAYDRSGYGPKLRAALAKLDGGDL